MLGPKEKETYQIVDTVTLFLLQQELHALLKLTHVFRFIVWYKDSEMLCPKESLTLVKKNKN